MKATLYLTRRVKYEWPQMYVDELVLKLDKKGYSTSIISDDTPEDVASKEITESELFIGVPNKFDSYACKGKRIKLLGATIKGEGAKSTVQCAGCVDKLDNMVDCLWQDELCMLEITPNDILEVACS